MGCKNCGADIKNEEEISLNVSIRKRLSFNDIEITSLRAQSFNEKEIDIERVFFKNINPSEYNQTI